jgi:hypothetical protein
MLAQKPEVVSESALRALEKHGIRYEIHRG